MTLRSAPRLLVVGAALPLVWFTQLNAAYALVPVACAAGNRASLQAVFIIALFLTLALTAVVVRSRAPEGEAQPPDSHWLSIRVAVTVEAVIFLIAVLLLGIPTVVVDPCA